jgi:ribonuclease PH
MRNDGREPDELRPITFERDFTEASMGCVLTSFGRTKVLCTASICGGYLALHDALARLMQQGKITQHPLVEPCAAISVGIIDGIPMLDLPYIEDAGAEVDMNVVMTGSGRFIEVQGTAEGKAFTRNELDSLLMLAEGGIKEIMALQEEMTSEPPARR